MMSVARQRDRASQLARTDTARSLGMAREIPDAWYRCQALAHVARYAPDAELARIAAEAVEAVAGLEDPYVEVGSAAWVVRALAERNAAEPAEALARRLVERSAAIGSGTSRADALILLLQAAWPLSLATRREVFDALAGAALSSGRAKAHHALRKAILIMGAADPEHARRLAEAMPEGRYRRQALRRLEAGEWWPAREFFF